MRRLSPAASSTSRHVALIRAFAVLLKSSDFRLYERIVGEVTKAFSDISSAIIATEAELRALGLDAPADLIRTVQEEERTKLQLVSPRHTCALALP